MHKALPFIVYPTLGLAIGWATVGLKPAGQPVATQNQQTARRERESSESRPAMNGDDYFRNSLAQVQARKSQGGTDISSLVAGWTEEEILSALVEAMKDPNALLNYSSMAGMLFEEFARRNPDRALEWIATLPNFQYKQLAGRLISLWPEERTHEALAFVRKNPELFGSSIPIELVTRSIAQVAGQGPDAVISLLEELADEGFPRNYQFPIKFGPDFDYAALLTSERFGDLQLQSMRSAIIRSWATADRDAVFQWLMETQGSGGMMSTLMPQWGTSPEKTRWFLGKLGAVGPEKITEFFEANRWQIASPSFNLTAWMNEAPPGIKEQLVTTASQALFMPVMDGVKQAALALETIPDLEERLRRLESLAPPKNLKTKIRPLADEDAAVLRDKLVEWGADATRTEAIITRYQNPPQP